MRQAERALDDDAVRAMLESLCTGRFDGRRVLVLIPDHTRSADLPRLFGPLMRALSSARQVDVMVALGTHPPLDEGGLYRLVGGDVPRGVRLLNHAWDDPGALVEIGRLEEDRVRGIAGAVWHTSLAGDVPVRINRAALECDQILIVGPVFPHEVVGFSGGSKYLFPGISGPEMIHKTHWLGALSGVVGTIGIQDTPVRRMIDAAAELLPTPVTLAALVMSGHDLVGMAVGGLREAWRAAADISEQHNIVTLQQPVKRVLSVAPEMYDELWTAAKAMYKLEPAMEPGGEVIIYAPHLAEISRVHGKAIRQVGYHILPYFLQDWGKYQHYPLGVLAHSTHLRGSGRMENGVELPNVRVTLASRIPKEECEHLNLGYMDPASVDLDEWRGREDEGVLLVPRAGEVLYRRGQ